MRTIETTATVTEDGSVTIDSPVAVPPGRHRVVLVVDEQTIAAGPTTNSTWPPGFIERTYGSLADLNLVREPQGDYEVREEIE